MRDGSGDNFFIVFRRGTTYIQGLAHESGLARQPPDQLFDGLPGEMADLRDEPAFGPRECSFVLWWSSPDGPWEFGTNDVPTPATDGSADLLAIFTDGARSYLNYARDYFEVELDSSAVAAVFASGAVQPDLIRAINPGADASVIEGELAAMGLLSETSG